MLGAQGVAGEGLVIAEFRFYGQLNDLLLPRRRQQVIRRVVNGKQTVKDAIEALGVPHPEVALVTVNGEPVDFAYLVRDGDRIAVYPPFAGLDLGPLGTADADAPAREISFAVDGHLGRLAAYLRALGFDTWYRNHAADGELAERSDRDDRVLLTRDRGLLKRSVVRRGYFVRSDQPTEQLAEVALRFGLDRSARPFGRCLRCNGLLEPVELAAVADRVPDRVRREQHEFRRCPDCDGLYWRGSHHARMQRLIEATLHT